MRSEGVCKSCEKETWVDALTNLCRTCELAEGKRWGHRDTGVVEQDEQ